MHLICEKQTLQERLKTTTDGIHEWSLKILFRSLGEYLSHDCKR